MAGDADMPFSEQTESNFFRRCQATECARASPNHGPHADDRLALSLLQPATQPTRFHRHPHRNSRRHQPVPRNRERAEGRHPSRLPARAPCAGWKPRLHNLGDIGEGRRRADDALGVAAFACVGASTWEGRSHRCSLKHGSQDAQPPVDHVDEQRSKSCPGPSPPPTSC